ncbi:MAG: Lhr family helicase, partial [Anaerolineae bacterium]
YLQVLEMRGEIRRGYFVEGLAGAQFALPEAVERLRTLRSTANAEEEAPVVLGAWDPALFAGPRLLAGLTSLTGSPLVRRPSSYAVLLRGRPLLWLERHGLAVAAPKDASDAECVAGLSAAFAAISARTGRRRLAVATWNGTPALGSPAQPLLEAAGCYPHAPVLEWTP